MFTHWMRYGRPRHYIIKVACWVWRRHNTPEWLLNFLYPDDCEISFQ